MKSPVSQAMRHFSKTGSPRKSRVRGHRPTPSDYVNILELLETRVLMDATSALVQLDATFGHLGLAQPGMTVDANGDNAKLSYSTFTDAGNGQMYALKGQKTNWAGPNAFSLIKLNADGSLDPTFNSPQQSYLTPQPDPLPWSGYSVIDVIKPEAIKVQTDGKIIVVVRDIPVGPPDPFLVFRYNTDGSLDPTFGTNGETIIPIDNSESDPSVFLTADGKIDLIDSAGASQHWNFADSTWIPSDPTLFFRQLNADGSMDASVGTNGVAASPLPALSSSFIADNHLTTSNISSAYIGAIAAPGGGFSVYVDDSASTPNIKFNGDTAVEISYRTHDETTVIQMDSSGNLGTSSAITSNDHANDFDPSMGSYVSAYVRPVSVLQPDGKLLVYKGNENGIIRYNADGTIDSTFQTGAVQFANGPSINTLAEILPQSDGKILILAVDPSGQFDAIQRLNPDGTPDTTFADGQAIYSGTSPAGSNYYGTIPQADQNLANLFASGSNFTTMPDGSIMVGTHGGFWSAGAIVKITPNGGTPNAYDVQAAVTDLAAAQVAAQAAYYAQQAANQAAAAAAVLAQNIANSPITNGDGSISTYTADGSASTVYLDGTISVSHADGTSVTTYPDGSISTHRADGSDSTVYSDGTITLSYADGTSVTTYPDGSSDTVHPDGSTTSLDASGHIVTTSSDPSSDPLAGGGLVRNGTDTQSTNPANDLLDRNAASLLNSNGAGVLDR
jgi:uncharacterized delta-60 repeat protein